MSQQAGKTRQQGRKLASHMTSTVREERLNGKGGWTINSQGPPPSSDPFSPARPHLLKFHDLPNSSWDPGVHIPEPRGAFYIQNTNLNEHAYPRFYR